MKRALGPEAQKSTSFTCFAVYCMAYSHMEAIPRHQCLIYDGSPAKMLPAIAGHIKQKLHENIRCLYLNSPAMVVGLKSYLFASGMNVAEEVERGRLIFSSDQDHLKNGKFDAEVMLQQLEQALNEALSEGFDGLWASGDMTWELGRDPNVKKLAEYEWKLERLFQENPRLSGLCQYHLGSLSRDAVASGLQSHPAIFVNQTLSRLNPHYHGAGAPAEPGTTTNELKLFIQNLCALQPEGGWNRF